VPVSETYPFTDTVETEQRAAGLKIWIERNMTPAEIEAMRTERIEDYRAGNTGEDRLWGLSNKDLYVFVGFLEKRMAAGPHFLRDYDEDPCGGIDKDDPAYKRAESTPWTNEWYLAEAKRVVDEATRGEQASWWKFYRFEYLKAFDVLPETMTERFKDIVQGVMLEVAEAAAAQRAARKIEDDRRHELHCQAMERRQAHELRRVAAEASAMISAGIKRLRDYEKDVGKHVMIPELEAWRMVEDKRDLCQDGDTRRALGHAVMRPVDEFLWGLQKVAEVDEKIALRLCRQGEESSKIDRTYHCARCGSDVGDGSACMSCVGDEFPDVEDGDDEAERRTRARYA
jgi:hypothetical protein